MVCSLFSGPTYNIKSKCFDYISENYMFYLSFENSMCLDYVTEKFFKALTFGILPIHGEYKNGNEICLSHLFTYLGPVCLQITFRDLAAYLLKIQICNAHPDVCHYMP